MISLLLATALAGCPQDCTRVLISKQRQAVEAKVSDVKKEKEEKEIIVKAEVTNDEGMKSEVKCVTINDTITCGW